MVGRPSEKNSMAELQAYGFAFITPLIIRSLVPPKKFYPVLLVTDNAKQIKEQVESAKNQQGGNRKPVILAGSIEILQTYLKQYPTAKDARVILFDFPGLLIPFFGKHLKWLDCDHQAGGSWQIARFSPEAFEALIEELSSLDQKGREFFLGIKRFVPNDQRISEIEKFTEFLPKTYKDLLSTLTADNGNAEKKASREAEASRKRGGTLKAMISTLLAKVPPAQHGRLVEFVLDYQLALITKRDFLNRAVSDLGTGFKDDILTIRKWIDSKSGSALYDAYLDYMAGSQKSWASLLELHKRMMEEDLLMLVARQPRTVESISRYTGVKPDVEVVDHPDMVKVEQLSKIFNYGKEEK